MYTSKRTIAVLEVMWDWNTKTSMANPHYLQQAPRCFRINPQNHSGKRLYWLLGHDNLLVTNACPQLVKSAKGKGSPDDYWLLESLEQLWPYELLLVCGNVAQASYDRIRNVGDARTIYMPHPAARQWTKKGLELARRFIQEGTADLHLRFDGTRLRATPLPPF